MYHALSQYDEQRYGDFTPSHRKYHKALSDLTFDYSEYFTAIFVRNPWDRIVSYYEMIASPRGRRRHRHFDQIKEQGFEGFIKNPGKALLSQCSSRAKGVKWIGKFENMKKDWKSLCGLLDIEVADLPKKNPSKRKKTEQYFTSQELIDLVGKHYAKDIKLYGYKPPKVSV